jgi:hypothetical protein
MASVLHGSARTMPRIRAELQASKERAGAVTRLGLNATPVRKWRKRTTTTDAPMGPKTPKSTVLTPAEEAIVGAFRQKTLPSLHDVLGCLKTPSPILAVAPCTAACSAMASPSFQSRDTGAPQEVQDPPDRLRPHRQLRTASCRRQAGHVPRHRPGLEVRLRRVPRQRRQDGRLSLPQCRREGLPPTESTPCPPTHGLRGLPRSSPACPRIRESSSLTSSA